MKKWKCSGCGYIWDGDEAPAVCPKCGATTFEELDESAATLVERSRRTNCLHARVISLAREIEALANEGIKDALDPGCVAVFQKALAHSYDLMKQSMTEMQGHVKKNKWG